MKHPYLVIPMLAALAFVAWAVPVRDRCWDPHAPKSTRVAVTRDTSGCLLHLASGDVRVDAAACSQLTCEPGVVSTLARARPGMILALLGLYAVGTLAWAARWRALLGFAGVDLRLREVWRISIEAQAGGVLLPGGIGGDALRIASVVARPTRAGEARSSVAIVRISSVFVLPCAVVSGSITPVFSICAICGSLTVAIHSWRRRPYAATRSSSMPFSATSCASARRPSRSRRACS